MPINFYFMPSSPPCQAIRIVAAAVGVELTEILTDTHAGQQMTPEYIKMNPQHTIPTIKDGDFVLWESRAIMAYLVNKYGKEDDPLYPKDPVKRALVDQRLYFDMGTLAQRFSDFFYPMMRQRLPADPEKFKKFEEALGFLDTYVKDSKYVAGDNITIADLMLMANVATYVDGGLNISIEQFPNIQRWYKDMKENAPGMDKLEEGLAICREFVKKLGLGKQ